MRLNDWLDIVEEDAYSQDMEIHILNFIIPSGYCIALQFCMDLDFNTTATSKICVLSQLQFTLTK